jgi:hypothetical protein
MAYRSVNFRDHVLWSLAYRLGLDPTVELLTDQAAALAAYINAWVRKSWDAVDWPEWTTIAQFPPDANHIVPYLLGGVVPNYISRVFKVFLADPHGAQGSVDTPFRLYSEGIHCGFEHGTNVWIRYIANPPVFTANVWNSAGIYKIGQMVYSPVSGECYQSLIAGNTNILPTFAANTMSVVLQQAFVAAIPASAAVNQQVTIHVADDPNYAAVNDIYNFVIADVGALSLPQVTYTTTGGQTLDQVLTALVGLTWPNLPSGGATPITVTKDTPNGNLILTAPAVFAVRTAQAVYQAGVSGPYITTNLTVRIVTSYAPAQSAVPLVPQQSLLTLPNPALNPGSTYLLNFIDQNGFAHNIAYVSVATDTANTILAALVAKFNQDSWLQGISLTPNYTNNTLLMSLGAPFQLNAVQQPPDSTAAWGLVPFPFALVDIVLRGAYSDCLKEWGQHEKASESEKAAGEEALIRGKAFTAPLQDQLSDKTFPKNRYTIPE